MTRETALEEGPYVPVPRSIPRPMIGRTTEGKECFNDGKSRAMASGSGGRLPGAYRYRGIGHLLPPGAVQPRLSGVPVDSGGPPRFRRVFSAFPPVSVCPTPQGS